MPFLAPGITFALHCLARLFAAPACVYASCYAVQAIAGYQVSQLFKWTACTSATPLYIYAKFRLNRYRQRRQAIALGAVDAPAWSGKWPGNFDILLYLMERFANDYLAAPFWQFTEALGNTFSMEILGMPQIFTIEPEHIKQILATEFHNFEKGDEFRYPALSVLGSGVFNSDGDMWKFHRSMTRPFFSRDRISHFALFERHADATIAHMASRFREGHAVDVQDAFSRFTLDSATEFLFGSCVHSLEAGLPYPASADPLAMARARTPSKAEEFASAFSDAQLTIATRLRLGVFWPLWELFGDKTLAPMKIVNTYLDPILADALAKKKNAPVPLLPTGSGEMKVDDIDEDETLLDHLVKYTDDKKILKDEILNIMIAGRDTTASTLTFVVYLLAMHPEVSARLRQEILGKVGNARSPTYADIREMKFLRAVLNETLRLYPVVPFNVRNSINATTLTPTSPGRKAIYVPPKTGVGYSVFMMHRRTDLWGPDAMEFDPDRFLDERLHKYLTPNPYIFVPFNAGPRICLGQQFAYNEASFMLVRLLQTFDFVELDPSAQPPETQPPPSWKNVPGRQSKEKIFPKAHLTMYAFGGLWVRMREAPETNV